MRVLPKTRKNRFGADLNNLAYLINDFLMPEIEARNFHDIWFQQDGVTCHTARETMDLLRNRFSEQFISRLGPVDWPPRPCDITPLDFYLWGYVKSKCSVDKPLLLRHWKPTLLKSLARYQPKSSSESFKIGVYGWTN